MKPARQSPGNRANSKGLTLIEVLVALAVLAIGLLGLAMLQTAGLRFTTDSYSRSQATLLAYDIIERMRANPSGFAAGNYDIDDAGAAAAAETAFETCKANTCNCESDTTVCSAAQLAQYDLGRWYEQQRALLLGANAAAAQAVSSRATIVRTGNSATVTLYWMEQDTLKSQAWQTVFGS